MLLHYSLVPAAHIPSSKFRRFAILSGDKGYLMSVQASTLDLQPSLVTTNAWRSRTLAVILMIAIAAIFCVDSRSPALLKRYHAGTQLKAAGALTFGAVYKVDRTMPLSDRVWRTTVNWLDANRVGMTFSFLFGPAALTFLATLRHRRTNSIYLNTLFGAAAGMPLAVCTNCVAPIARGFYASGMSTESVLAAMFASPALNVVVLAMTFALFPISIALLKLATVLFLIFVFAPAVASRQSKSPPPIVCPIEIPDSETWSKALVSTRPSFHRAVFPQKVLVPFPCRLSVDASSPRPRRSSHRTSPCASSHRTSHHRRHPLSRSGLRFSSRSHGLRHRHRLHRQDQGRPAPLRRHDPLHLRHRQRLLALGRRQDHLLEGCRRGLRHRRRPRHSRRSSHPHTLLISRSPQFDAAECFKHFFFGWRLQNIALRKFFSLWILSRSNTPGSFREIVRTAPKLNVRSQ